jgi:hypothetical protein
MEPPSHFRLQPIFSLVRTANDAAHLLNPPRASHHRLSRRSADKRNELAPSH